MVVVLEHQNCGAVAATLKELKRPTENRSPNLGTIVDRIRPAVEPLISTSANDATLLRKAIQANVRASVSQLKRGSGVLETLVRDDGLLIVGSRVLAENRRP